MRFVGEHFCETVSVLTALLGVACSLAPYFIIIRIIPALRNVSLF